MTVALPLPYEDELLYNVVGRYMERTCVDVPTPVIRNLFGRLVYPTGELFGGLGELAHQTYDSWGLSARQIVQRHTPLPYFTSYATEERSETAYRAVVDHGTARAMASLGLTASRVDRPTTFRYCEQCAVDDIARVGEAYWRRSHQLPGVFVCIKHELPLRNSAASVKLRRSSEWSAGNSVITSALGAVPAGAAAWANNVDVFEVMRKSTELLASTASQLLPSMTEHYFALAQAAGLAKPSGLIKIETVRKTMRSMYGDEYLSAVGLSLPAATSGPWAVAMMLRSSASHQPLQHILLNHFFERCGRTSATFGAVRQMTARQRFICPNRYASHETRHIIERVKVEEADDGRIGRGYCSCGLKFTFRRCLPETCEPEILRIYAFGQDWNDAAKHMRRNGMSIAAIAEDMDVPRDSVKVMLKRRGAADPKDSESEILKWREEWTTVLKEVAPGGHKVAKKADEHLYYLLNRYDKDWLRQSAKPYVQARNAISRKIRVDWTSRDREWSVELRKAAAKLLFAKSQCIRASKMAIVAEASIYILHRSVFHKLPLCRAALAEVEESREQFQLRRLEAEAQRMIANAELVVGWKLLRRVGIPTSRLTPTLEAAVARLEQTME